MNLFDLYLFGFDAAAGGVGRDRALTTAFAPGSTTILPDTNWGGIVLMNACLMPAKIVLAAEWTTTRWMRTHKWPGTIGVVRLHMGLQIECSVKSTGTARGGAFVLATRVPSVDILSGEGH